MTQNYKVTFYITLTLIFLSPLFFIPRGTLDLGSAKSTLFSIGVVLSVLTFLFESWRQGQFSFPKNYFLVTVALLPLVYLLSALLSTPSSLSLLGYNFEVGTFGFMLLGSAILIVMASLSLKTERFLQALVALFTSLSLLAIFTIVKIASGGAWLNFGNFSGNMGNPLGSWTDLAMVFALLSIFATLALGMVPMRPLIKSALYVVFVASTALLVILGFSTAFAITLGASILLFFYFSKIEKHFLLSSRSSILPIILGVISLIMFINPTVSAKQGSLGHVISSAFSVQNTDVRPTLSATLDISKAVLSKAGLLGSGPNTFGHDWLIFKPVNINATPFWGVAFPFGVGFIPTQIASTGILGSALWLCFFALLITLCIRALSHIPESRASRFVLVSTLFITLFLWAGALLYVPSAAVLILAFIFTGLLLAVSREVGIISAYEISLREHTPARFVAMTSVVLVAVGALYLGEVSVVKTVAATHFKQAVDLSNTEGVLIGNIENQLAKAVALDPIDTYYVAISRLNFSKAQVAASSASGTPEQNKALFEDALRKSIEAARSAVNANPAGYENWVSLGLIYSSLVAEPLKVEGAYENAQFAYNEAMKRNPNNPELALFLARLEIAKGNADNARSYIRNSIALKEDYADAYLLLAQLEVREKHIPQAIASTEALATLVPGNAGIHFELGVMKYSSGDYEGAVISLSQAIKITPDYANAKYYLALAYTKLGQIDEARTQLEDLIVTNPDSPELKAALKALNPRKKI